MIKTKNFNANKGKTNKQTNNNERISYKSE